MPRLSLVAFPLRFVALLTFSTALWMGCAADTPEETAEAPLDAGPMATANAAVAEIAALDSTRGVTGRVEFIETDGTVEVRYNLAGLAGPGPFGFHVHENGSCAPDSAGTPGGAAGGHLNPMASPHGAPGGAATARHAGDLGNVTPDAEGRAVGTVRDSVLAFEGPTSMLGKAVVVHSGTDDLVTQPSGDAGGRIGCGIVQRRGDETP